MSAQINGTAEMNKIAEVAKAAEAVPSFDRSASELAAKMFARTDAPAVEAEKPVTADNAKETGLVKEEKKEISTQKSRQVKPVEEVEAEEALLKGENVEKKDEHAASEEADDDIPAFMKDKKGEPTNAGQAFAKIKKENAVLKKELEAFKSGQVKAPDAQTAEMQKKLAEYEAKQKELSDYNQQLEDIVRISKIEESREFKSAYVEPMKKLKASVETIAKAADKDVNEIMRLVTIRDDAERRKAFKAASEDMDPADIAELRSLGSEIAKLESNKEFLMQDAKSTLETLTKKEQEKILELEAFEKNKAEKEKALRLDQSKKIRESIFKDFEPEVLKEFPFLEEHKDDPSYRAEFDKIRANVDFVQENEVDTQTRVQLDVQAFAFPTIVGIAKGLKAELEKVLAENAKLRGTKPKQAQGKPKEIPAAGEPEYKTYAEAQQGLAQKLFASR
jgi:hypothetical protein